MPSNLYVTLLITACGLLFVGMIAFFYYKNAKRVRTAPYLSPGDRDFLDVTVASDPTTLYRYETFSPLCPCDRTHPCWEAQPRQWQESMRRLGRKLHDHRVGALIFVHGTFVGEDPFDLFKITSKIAPQLASELRQKLWSAFQLRKNTFIGDLGAFTPAYINLAATALNHGLACYDFPWSSGNHHLARLTAAIELLAFLEAIPLPKGRTRLLLIGHSHAGQLFALSTQMLADANLAATFYQLVFPDSNEEQLGSFLQRLRQLQTYNFDFVTLGAPARYRWDLSAKQRALHLINHRPSRQPLNGFRGILSTRFGDYVQLWGGQGSDALSPIKQHMERNRQLNAYLGEGFNLSLWRHEVQQNKRKLHPSGLNLLVDYLDHSQETNCFATMFGHGVYTKYETMLYNMNEIAKHFYS